MRMLSMAEERHGRSGTPLERLIYHLEEMPRFLWDGQRSGLSGEEWNGLRVWLDELYERLNDCEPTIREAQPGHGLDHLWLRNLVAIVSHNQSKIEEHGLGEYWVLSHGRFGIPIRGLFPAADGIREFRRRYIPGGVASLLEDQTPSPLSLLRSKAKKYEQRWLEASLPPQADIVEHRASRYEVLPTDLRTDLRRSLGGFGKQAGELLLQTTDDLQIPKLLWKDFGFVAAVNSPFFQGASLPCTLFDWFCQEWLPSQREGYGTEDCHYPGCKEDDSKRFNLGVRKARCAIALVDALEAEITKDSAQHQPAKESQPPVSPNAKPGPKADDETDAASKPRGRKKADHKTVQREAELAANWARSRDIGVYKADFAKEQKMRVKDFNRLLDRVAKRKKSSE